MQILAGIALLLDMYALSQNLAGSAEAFQPFTAHVLFAYLSIDYFGSTHLPEYLF